MAELLLIGIKQFRKVVAVLEREGKESNGYWFFLVLPWQIEYHVVSVKLRARMVMLHRFIWGENLPIHHLFCFPRRMWLFFFFFLNSFAAYSTYKNNVGNKRFLANGKFGKV